MKISKKIIEEVTKSVVAIENAMEDAQIQAKLESYGYSAEKMQEGKTKVLTVQQTLKEQQAAYGKKFAATDLLQQLKNDADTEYRRIRGIANIAFRGDRSARQTLGTNQRYPANMALWLEKTQQLYDNALASAAILARLGEFGVTKEQLEAGRQKVLAVANALKEREKTQGEAQQITYRRKQVTREFRQWTRDFYAIVKLALQDEPQMREKLGLVDRS